MKRTELKMVVKALSEWNIDKRKGDYTLLSGSKLSQYLESITRKFLEKMELAIAEDGNVYSTIDGRIFIPFGHDEKLENLEQLNRVEFLIKEMLH